MKERIPIPIQILQHLYYDQELGVPEISRRLGISQATIYCRMRKLGLLTRSVKEAINLTFKHGRLPANTRCFTDEELEEMKRLYLEGKRKPELAERFNCGNSTLSKRLTKMGVCGKGKISHVGPRNPRWRGGRHKTKDGYISIAIPGKDLHRTRLRNERVISEHRMIWEQHRGSLPKGWVVHHLNGIRDDNRIGNLMAMPKNKHHSYLFIQALQQRIKELENERFHPEFGTVVKYERRE